MDRSKLYRRFRSLLIANRGEIAVRVIRTAKAMGLRTVAVYSEADRNARHVAMADEAVLLGPSRARDSYLNIERVIGAARASGAEAIHPGYGFLSENADFAKACLDAGLVFVGPTAEMMQAMGSKSGSKQLMEKASVPLVPGYHGEAQDDATLAKAAAKIGFPVLVKASAGGGGRGMRVVRKADELAASVESAKREARAAFGDDRMLIEKLVENPRHIEVQVIGDSHGNLLSLFERECTLQRRHQKVIEEAPSPTLNAAQRDAVCAVARKAAAAVGYVGAGTIEFVSDGKDVFFIEMNTRLQVEHPVTELITGIDLVEWQLRVAAGEPLPLQQSDLRIHGHAIEARICAENPDRDFLPATGTLHVYRKPPHTSFQRGTVRIDDGVLEGDAISPFYDSMIAKLIVHGATREEALARLDEALAATHIAGLHTNVQFLRHVVTSRSFAEADLDTALIQREQAVLFKQDKVGLPLAAAAAVAKTLLDEQSEAGRDPFSRRDGWRSHGNSLRRFAFEFGGHHAKAELQYLHDGALRLAVGENVAPLAFRATDHGIELRYGDRHARAAIYTLGETDHVFTAAGATQIVSIDLLAHAGEGADEGGRLTAPMPGKVVSFAVKAGDKVKKGQPLAVMEAMKMEHTIAAPGDGTVAELLYAPGDQVAEGAELLRLGT